MASGQITEGSGGGALCLCSVYFGLRGFRGARATTGVGEGEGGPGGISLDQTIITRWGGTALAAEILQTFKDLHMDHTWADSHYATLQFPSRLGGGGGGGGVMEGGGGCWRRGGGGGGGGEEGGGGERRREEEEGGGEVEEDFDRLRSAGVSVIGCVVVMRVGGGVSYAEKVLLAQKAGAGGALIYPDPADIPQDPRRLGLNSYTAISEH
ncbi:unnamed protein product, partial [Coregonus sp. 'balchen']